MTNNKQIPVGKVTMYSQDGLTELAFIDCEDFDSLTKAISNAIDSSAVFNYSLYEDEDGGRPDVSDAFLKLDASWFPGEETDRLYEAYIPGGGQ